MNTWLFMIQKEFLQIIRNRTLLPIIFVMPLVQLLILVYAADMNMKRIEYIVFDEDGSGLSGELELRYLNSPFFDYQQHVYSEAEGDRLLREGKADILIRIPEGFEKMIVAGEPARVQMLVDGINSAAAVLVSAYANQILKQFSLEFVTRFSPASSPVGIQRIGVSYRHWFNKELDFKVFMVPGILVLLVSMIGWILTALNIVREKELGTIEQLNVSPVGKFTFIAGKLFPFWVIALFELAFGLALGKLIFDIPVLGSLGVLFLFTAVYLFVPLGFGLMISAFSENQQQVMFLAFFFNLTFILMSGLFTPVESMPDWAEYVNYLNPLAYFMRVIRMILLKGAGLADILPELAGIALYSVLIISLAVMAYRKRA